MRIKTRLEKFIVCASLFAVGSALAVDRTWTGGAGTTVINTGANWSGGVAPTTAAGDRAIWDGIVQTNEPFVWSTAFGSGNTGGTGIEVGAGYTSAFTLMGTTGQNAGISNIVIRAGAGAFTLGDTNGVVVSTTVWRGGGTNGFLNYSDTPGTIAQNVQFNNGGGAGRSIYLIGNWNMFSPIQPAGAGGMTPIVDGNGANVVTLNAAITLNSQNWTINNGTLMPTIGDALAIGGTQTLTIGGGAGVKRLGLTNDVYMNPAVANYNIAGRDSAGGAAEAAIYNISGNNTLNGTVRFNAVGGTNVIVYNSSGTLTLNSNLTAGTVTGDRYFTFDGPATTTINGSIVNGTANLGLRQGGGTLVLNNANTYSGKTILNGGVLTIGNDLALANTTVEVNGGKLDINGGNGFSPSVAGLSGAGVVDTLTGGAPVLSVGNNNVSSSFSGNLTNSSGALSLNKIGTGTFSLSGASGYSGGTTVSTGTLLANNTVGSGTGSGGVTVVAGAAFGGTGKVQGAVDWQPGSAAQFTLTPANVAGSNATQMTISGSLTLNGNAVTINVAGGTPLSAGTYRLMNYTAGASGAFATLPTFTGAGVQLGSAYSLSTSGGAVTLTVTLPGVVSAWTNDVDGNWATGANWSSSPYYPQVSGDIATLGVGSAFRTVTLNTAVTVGTILFTNANSFHIANAGNPLTFAGAAGALVNVAAGSSNAISSAINLNTNLTIAAVSGTSVAITNAISNSGGARTLSVSGPGTVVLSGNNTYGPSAGSLGTAFSGNGVLELGHNNALGAGDVSMGSSGTIRARTSLTLANNIIDGAGTATVDNNGNNVTLSGVISGAGALTKNGAGTLTLGAANSYAGNTTINAGTVVLGNAASIPGGTNQGNLTLNADAMLNLNGKSPVLNGLNSATNTTVVDTLAGGAVTLTLGESGAGGAFLGSLKNTSGSVSVVKNGAGFQTLAGTNSYTGTTTINNGTLQIGNGGTVGNLGAGSVSLNATNANLQFNLSGANAVANNISGQGTVTLANTNLVLWLTGNNTFTGNVQNNGGVLWITNQAALGVGPKTVVAVGNLASQFTQLRLGGGITLDSSIAFSLSYGGGVLVNASGSNTIQGTIAMPNGGGNPLIIASNGLLTLAGDIATVLGNNARTLTLDGPANGFVSGNIIDSGLPQVSVTKNGSGTWTLSGLANAYSGATTVNAGTLLINGNNYGAGTVTVNSNATLGGTGVLSSAVTWQANSKGRFTASSGGYTPLAVYGNVTLNNNAIEVFVDGGVPLPPGTYTLLWATGTLTGSFNTIPVITGAGVQSGMIASVVSSGTQVLLTVSSSATWTSGVNGNWTAGANWSSNPQYPDAAGEFANLGVGSTLITINLNASQTVGGVTFTNVNSFVITNANNTLTLNNAGNGAVLSALAGASNAVATKISLDENAVVNTATGAALLLSGNVEGFGGLTFTGSGAAGLSGSNNSYSGTTTLSGGRLTLGSTNALGLGLFSVTGGQIDSSVPNLVNANNNIMTWGGGFNFLGSQNLNLGSGSVTLTANMTVGVESNSLAIGGSIDGAFGLTKAGPGTLVLSAPNSFTGGTIISNGTIVIGNDAAFGTGILHLGLTTGAGVGATIRSSDASPRTIANNSQANITAPNVFAGSGDLTFTGTMGTGNGTKTFIVSNAVTTFSGLVTDNGAPTGPIIKDGPGKLVVSANNTLTKQFQINAGTLALGSSTAIGSGALIINGGGLDTTVPGLVFANNNPQTWNGSFFFAGSSSLDIGSGAVTMSTNVTITVSNNTLTVGGVINGTTNGLDKAGLGTLVLNGTNHYGNTTVSGGTLQILQATLATNSTVAVSNGALLRLIFTTTNQVAALVLNGTSQPAGVYTSSTPGGYLAGSGALRVVPMAPPGPSGPVLLTNSISGSTLSLSWPAGQGWKLQVQTNSRSVGLSTNWTSVTDGSVSSTNITVDKVQPTIFYRLAYP